MKKCESYLSEGNDKSEINSAISLLIRFFDIYDGRDLSLSSINQSSCFGVHVYSADDNIKKVVNIPYNEDVTYLRKMIADAFDLSVNEFALYVNQKQITPEDDDQMIREIGFSCVYVIKKIQNFMTDQHPKNLLVGDIEFFNRMFDLLSNDEDYDVENIWKLLMKLPQDEVPTAKLIQQLEIEDDENAWDDLIDGSSLHKLLYSLQIINKLQFDEEWQNKFLVMGGINHLFKTFLRIDANKINSTLAFKSVDILCKLFCESMEKTPELMTYFKERNLEVVEQIIKIIHQLTRWSLVELKKRGESYDDLYYKNRQAEQKNFRLLNYYSDKNKNEPEEDDQNQYSRLIHALNAKFDEVGKFISLSFRLLYHFDAYTSEACIKKLNEYEDLEDLLSCILLKTDNFYIRDQFIDGLSDMLCHPNNDLEAFIIFKKRVLNILIYKISKELHTSPTRSYKYNDFMVKLLFNTKNSILEKMNINFEEVLEMNTDIIINKESTEKSSNDFDTILCGAIKIVKVILQQFPQHKQAYGEKLLRFLLKECLFEVPKVHKSRSKVRPPKCKNALTRSEVFRLINVLARD